MNKLKNSILSFLAFPAFLICWGCQEIAPEQEIEERTVLTVELNAAATKTALGELSEGVRKVYWTNGDKVALNGTESDALEGLGENATSATFSFSGVINTPFNILYPSSFYKDATTITLPAIQAYTAGTFAPDTAPLAGCAPDASGASIAHLCSYIHLKVKKSASVSASNLASVSFSGKGGEQVCGDFTIDYQYATISPAGSGSEVTLNVDQPLSESTALELFLVVPAREYASGFSIVLKDNYNRTMTKVKSSGITLEAGKLTKFPEFEFIPSPTEIELGIPEVYEEVIAPDGFNVKGFVKDNSGNGIEGVVVSDGINSVRTMFDGSFFLTSDIANTKFIQISTPSGYLPPVEQGKPRFYKLLSGITPSGGVYDCGTFTLTPVANPDTFTLFMTADPQPRATSLSLDNVAYRSTRCCEALYLDLAETAATITNRQVYGICLGDLVHEDMDLMSTYSTALGTLGYPTYNVIGNHDNDPDGADDDEGAIPFESYFGPRNYSFNIGGIHFVVLDNLIMKMDGSRLTGFDQGLTDDIWTWLQGDLSFIPTSSTIMVCAHSPMFKLESGNERSNSANHGADYGALFDKYAEVHAWAGHTHSTFNYVYPSTHRHKRIQVHTLARSTGELWTNEYLSNGTPRGFTIVEVENGSVNSWRFHPTKYLKSNHHGTPPPTGYMYRDWEYEGSSPLVAKMKDTGLDLDESYQMHVYAPDTYSADSVYVNVFLWDNLWETPVFTPAGGSARVMDYLPGYNDKSQPFNKINDAADIEFRSFYYSNSSLLKSAGYKEVSPITTLFRAYAADCNSGTVSVTDRFGNTYTRSISW